MGKLLVHQFVSLDGYAADAGGDFSLFDGGDVTTPEFDLELLVRLQLVDAILLGATTYRMFADYWPTPASGNQLIAPTINGIEKIVFSRTLDEAPWGEFAPARIESGDAVEVIRALKEEKFGDLLVWGSLSLTDALFAAGLVDSVRIAVLPVILGSGRSPFPNGFAEREIRLVDSHTFDVGIVASEYAVGHHAPVVTGAIEAPTAVPATDDDATDAAPSAGAADSDAGAESAAPTDAVDADSAPGAAAPADETSVDEVSADAASARETPVDETPADATSAPAPASAPSEAWPVDRNAEASVPTHAEPSPYPEAWNIEHAGTAWSDRERPGADLTGPDVTGPDLTGPDPVETSADDASEPQASTEQPSTEQASADQASTEQASTEEPATDQAPPAYPSPDEFASGSAASTAEASAEPAAAISDPWQPPAAPSSADPGQSTGESGQQADNAGQTDSAEGEGTPDGTGTPENFGTPEATDNAGDDSASATNPAPDPTESEWLVSRRKWE